MIPVYSTIADIRVAVASARSRGERIALVPTMGALHAGHAALVRAARAQADFVVVSVFVNPTQFGPKEDFNKYPRTLDADAALSESAGAGAIFAPSAADMYPPNFRTFVEVEKLDAVLCEPRRPGHFRGVCTVVLKLFNIVQPDLAVFGAKDAQQSIILKRMVLDLDLPIEMLIEPTIREADGLAMSSRNKYLSPAERAEGPRIYRALLQVQQSYSTGERNVAILETELRKQLEAIPNSRVDYAEIRDAQTLESLETVDRPALAAVAIFVGTTRLIDNVTFG